MRFLFRSATLIALCSAALLSLPSCSQQGEGERCDSAANGNLDCDSGLVCVSQNELREHVTDRCCPPDLSSTDPRCDRATGTTGAGGTSGGGSGTAGTGGTIPAGGMSGAGGENFGGVFEIGDEAGVGGAAPAGASSGGAG